MAIMPIAQARQQFIDVLTQARGFAWRVDSHLVRSFGAARELVLNAIDSAPLVPAGLASPDLDWEPDTQLLVQLFT